MTELQCFVKNIDRQQCLFVNIRDGLVRPQGLIPPKQECISYVSSAHFQSIPSHRRRLQAISECSNNTIVNENCLHYPFSILMDSFMIKKMKIICNESGAAQISVR